MAVYADYDGTITNLDTFDVLVRACAGAQESANLERALQSGRLTLREVLERQASFVHLSIDEADDLLRAETKIDPAFKPFVQSCIAHGASVTVLSSGIQPLIRRALARAGLAGVPVIANEVTPSRQGWTIRFIDGSDNGHDKAAAVQASLAAGNETVYCGDGHSDFAAARAANRRFAKRGRALERYLRDASLPFVAFDSFTEVDAALW